MKNQTLVFKSKPYFGNQTENSNIMHFKTFYIHNQMKSKSIGHKLEKNKTSPLR